MSRTPPVLGPLYDKREISSVRKLSSEDNFGGVPSGWTILLLHSISCTVAVPYTSVPLPLPLISALEAPYLIRIQAFLGRRFT